MIQDIGKSKAYSLPFHSMRLQVILVVKVYDQLIIKLFPNINSQRFIYIYIYMINVSQLQKIIAKS